MSDNGPMEVLLANPRGFCAGVERAIEIVERALELHGAPIYVRHEIVHNKYVVQDLRAKGAAASSAARRQLSRRTAGQKKADFCSGRKTRQDAVKFMAPQCDVVIVVGSPNSSNSNRLREVSENMGVPAYLVDSAADLRP